MVHVRYIRPFLTDQKPETKNLTFSILHHSLFSGIRWPSFIFGRTTVLPSWLSRYEITILPL